MPVNKLGVQEMKITKHVALFVGSVAGVMIASSYNANAENLYIEGQLGAAWIKDVDSNTISGTASGITFTNVGLTIDYDTALAFGVEAGGSIPGADHFRVGISFKQLDAKLNSATLRGSVTDGTTTLTGPATFSRADLDTVGISADNKALLYSVNMYYDFKNDSAFTPYLGAGIGIADIKNAKDIELALNLSAGVNYDIMEQVYIGVRGDYNLISGPEDELGIKYDDIQALSILATIGFKF